MIAETAVIADGAQLAPDVEVGAFTIVHPNVVLQAGVRIGSHCTIGEPSGGGEPLRLGAGSTVRSHSVLYEGSSFGPGLQTGHHVLIRSGVSAGSNVVVGTQCDLEGDATLGDAARLHSEVHLAQHSHVGRFAFIFPRVTFTNDPFPPSETHVAGITVGEMAVVATGTLLLPGVTIGIGSFVSAGSRVQGHVPAAMVYGGAPARPVCGLEQFVHPEHGRYHPWVRRFMSRYPQELHTAVDETVARVDAAIAERRKRERQARRARRAQRS
jgi:UDP-3-O-[3-hydroxymyristoyl] glucosamine N-acyltransferase